MRSSKNGEQAVNSTELKPRAAQIPTIAPSSCGSEPISEQAPLSPNHMAVKNVFNGNGNAAALLHIFACCEIVAAQKHDRSSTQNHGISS
ncbi:MAG: hypothetical protein VX737_04445 [Pseudomonadota bacterium]|nr:hypothetical protein [Pseudomonadota bacterium]